jgi:DNA polymerase
MQPVALGQLLFCDIGDRHTTHFSRKVCIVGKARHIWSAEFTVAENVDEQLGILHDTIRTCTLCHLSQTRKKAVPGEGPVNARVMFVGEGPGRNEDLEGRPFVGRSGNFLEECLAGIGLRRDQVFICNVVKCRPFERPAGVAKDRRPTGDEIRICSPYLERQIELVRPLVICCLGDTAITYIFKKYGLPIDSIGRIHGRQFNVDGLTVVALYHPAAALYAAPLREIILRDFQDIGELLRK